MNKRVKYQCSNKDCNSIIFDAGEAPCPKCGSKSHIVVGTEFGEEEKLVHIKIEFKTTKSNERIFMKVMETINKLPTMNPIENFCKPEEEVKPIEPIQKQPEEKWN